MKLLEFPRDREIIDKVVKNAELASLMIPSPRETYIKEVCEQAKTYGFAAVIATPYDCPAVLELLKDSGVETVCNIALNHALDENLECRLYSVGVLLDTGIRKFEMAVPCGLLRDGKYDVIEQELTALHEKISEKDGDMSIIIENDCMSKQEQAELAKLAVKLGVSYVRNCSGMERICGSNGGRATIHSISYLAGILDGKTELKAGGGWDYAYLEDCVEYMNCGASRVDVGPLFVEQLQQMGYRR